MKSTLLSTLALACACTTAKPLYNPAADTAVKKPYKYPATEQTGERRCGPGYGAWAEQRKQYSEECNGTKVYCELQFYLAMREDFSGPAECLASRVKPLDFSPVDPEVSAQEDLEGRWQQTPEDVPKGLSRQGSNEAAQETSLRSSQGSFQRVAREEMQAESHETSEMVSQESLSGSAQFSSQKVSQQEAQEKSQKTAAMASQKETLLETSQESSQRVSQQEKQTELHESSETVSQESLRESAQVSSQSVSQQEMQAEFQETSHMASRETSHMASQEAGLEITQESSPQTSSQEELRQDCPLDSNVSPQEAPKAVSPENAQKTTERSAEKVSDVASQDDEDEDEDDSEDDSDSEEDSREAPQEDSHEDAWEKAGGSSQQMSQVPSQTLSRRGDSKVATPSQSGAPHHNNGKTSPQTVSRRNPQMLKGAAQRIPKAGSQPQQDSNAKGDDAPRNRPRAGAPAERPFKEPAPDAQYHRLCSAEYGYSRGTNLAASEDCKGTKVWCEEGHYRQSGQSFVNADECLKSRTRPEGRP